MRAAVLHAPNQVSVETIPDPEAGPGEIVLRVGAAAICGTDMRIYRGRKTKGVRYPSVIGHEFAGEVVAVGAGIANFAVGDTVGVDPVIPCGRCAYCLTGRENVCANRQAMGYEFDGAFAELIRIPAIGLQRGNVFKLPAGVDLAHAALAEPLACVMNGQENMGVGMNEVVVVLGAGPIGLMHLKLANLAGARKVIVSEPNPGRRARAATQGARVVDPTAEDLDAVVRSETEGLGADAVILAIGAPQIVNQALGLARKGGRINLFAGFSKGDMPPIDVNLIHYNELVITGASALQRRHYQAALGLIASGRLDVSDLVSHRIALDDFETAMAIAESGEGVKVVVGG